MALKATTAIHLKEIIDFKTEVFSKSYSQQSLNFFNAACTVMCNIMCLWVNLEQHQCSNYQEKPYLPKTGTSPLDVIIKVLLLVLTEVSKAIARYVKTGISYTLINILVYLTQLRQNFQAPR